MIFNSQVPRVMVITLDRSRTIEKGYGRREHECPALIKSHPLLPVSNKVIGGYSDNRIIRIGA